MNVDGAPSAAVMDNYKSALQNKEQVEEQIKEELAEGRYVFTDTPPTIISALGAISKESGGIRLIHDCSRPSGKAVNDYAIKDATIKYQTVTAATKLLDPNGFMAKLDLKSAYRSVALHPSQYKYTGLKWTFSGETKPRYLIDTRLCFGARLSPSIFHRLTQAVCRMMARKNYKTIVYLDDFLILSSSQEHCNEGLLYLISLLRELGFAIAWPKVVSPSQSIVFLGVLIDSRSMTLQLPQEKVASLKSLLHSFKARTRASRRQLESLAGKLVYCCQLVRGGRIYLQRVFDTIRALKSRHHKVLLSEEFHKDIEWWLQYLDCFNCVSIISPDKPTYEVCTDASPTGAGLATTNDWLYLNWERDLPHVKNAHINVKETIAVVAAVYRWGPMWAGGHVTVYTDNITTRAAINKGRCVNHIAMDYIRQLFWITEFFNITITCIHIPGKQNVHADAISRLNERGSRLYWFSVLANYHPYTSSDVAQWLLDHCSPASAGYLYQQVMEK